MSLFLFEVSRREVHIVLVRSHGTATLPTTPSIDTHCSVTIVTTLARAFKLDTCIIRLFLSTDGELRTE